MKTLMTATAITLGLALNAFSEDFKAPKETEVVKIIKIQRNLAVLEKGSQNISNIYRAINLLHLSDDPYNSDELKTLEDLVPAIRFILNHYDQKVTPVLLNQAAESNNIYFKRRAIYCIEKLSGLSMEEIIKEKFGEGERPEKLRVLAENTTVPKRDISWYFPPLGSTLDDALEGLKK